MLCDRCHEENPPVEQMLHITVHEAAGVKTTEEVFLCPRCSLFLLSLLGATPHVMTMKHPEMEKWLTDAVLVNKEDLAYIALKLITTKFPKEDNDADVPDAAQG